MGTKYITNVLSSRSIAVGGGIDFRRQLAEHNASEAPVKKFRSSAAPKGAKLAAGYTDRTKQRISEEDDDKATRVKNLEEMLKLQQIDQPTFEKLRDEIVGGDIGSVHLVKGLDYKLLERVRRGEDVLNGSQNGADEEAEDVPEEDAEEELEVLESREVAPVTKEKTVKKGEMAPPTLVPGKKRPRDQILAELKTSRAAAKAAAAPSLGAKFKKVGAARSESRIEIDSKGREVLITVDEDGNEKRKVRKMQPTQEAAKDNGLLMPDKDVAPLGMEVPELPKPAEEEDEDIDIFDDAGDDYDPLAGLAEGDGSGSEEGEAAEPPDKVGKQEAEVKPQEKDSMPPPPRPRNYFRDSKPEQEATSHKAMSDPTILAAIQKAAKLRAAESAEKSEEEKAREAKLKKMLEMQNRDAADLDMGFGSSRLEDEADFDDKPIKLSQWKGGHGDDDDDEDGGRGEGKGKRKRAPKKRKGDVNNVADVLKVIERRKGESS
jgi:hypothetical protein